MWSLNKADITEAISFWNPPSIVLTIFRGLLALMDGKDYDWDSIRKRIGKA